MQTDTTWSEFSSERKAIAEQILVSEEEIYKSKRARLWVTARDLNRKVNDLTKAIWDRESQQRSPGLLVLPE